MVKQTPGCHLRRNYSNGADNRVRSRVDFSGSPDTEEIVATRGGHMLGEGVEGNVFAGGVVENFGGHEVGVDGRATRGVDGKGYGFNPLFGLQGLLNVFHQLEM